jgi:hypothetical protein
MASSTRKRKPKTVKATKVAPEIEPTKVEEPEVTKVEEPKIADEVQTTEPVTEKVVGKHRSVVVKEVVVPVAKVEVTPPIEKVDIATPIEEYSIDGTKPSEIAKISVAAPVRNSVPQNDRVKFAKLVVVFENAIARLPFIAEKKDIINASVTYHRLVSLVYTNNTDDMFSDYVKFVQSHRRNLTPIVVNTGIATNELRLQILTMHTSITAILDSKPSNVAYRFNLDGVRTTLNRRNFKSNFPAYLAEMVERISNSVVKRG